MVKTRLLTQEQERLREELRAALTNLVAIVSELNGSAEDRDLISKSIRGLNDFFLLVVVGEFNAGKSALLNELLGTRLLPEGVTPTTAAITIVRYGERESEEWLGDALMERRLPSPLLKDLAVVDTPGTNAIVRRHEELTREFVPRADMILFITSTDRPFTETERELLTLIRDWGKKVVVVINKIDLLETQQAVDEVVEFVQMGLLSTLSLTPPIFPTSVKLARSAAENADPAVSRALASAGRLDELRNYVFDTLDEETRLRLKLTTPLGIAENLVTKYSGLVAERMGALTGDRRLVAEVEDQIEGYSDDLRRSFVLHLAEIENVIHELNDRGEKFFDETVRITRVFDLLNTERTRGEYEREVLSDMSEKIDAVVGRTVDWFLESESRLWRQISGMVAERQRTVTGVNESPDFLVARREVLRAVDQRTKTIMEGFEREREAREIGRTMHDTVAQTALAQVGAVSLGAAIALLFGTAVADITGILAATLLGALGLYIIPARRRQALQKFRQKTEELRERLVNDLQAQLEREIGGSTERVREAIAPYTRYVRAEGNRLETQWNAMFQLRERLARLQAEIDPAKD